MASKNRYIIFGFLCMSSARAFLQTKVPMLQAPSFLQRGSHLTVHAPSEEQDTLSTAALVLPG